MTQQIRFGSFIREVTVHQDEVSYNNLIPKVEYDATGKERPCQAGRLQLRSIDVYRLVVPYFNVRFIEQARAVIPLAIYLILFQLFILKQDVSEFEVIMAGLASVIVGLMLFMEGLKVGLMPLGNSLGTSLPTKSSLPTVLTVAFILGIGVTFAEPAIGALKTAGQIVTVEKSPYLYALLNDWSEVLVLLVGAGVGLAAVLGTIRFLYGWSLKPFIYLTLIPTLGLTLYISTDPELSKILGLAWDCGAVTTGPVTVPLVLSLGIGIASSAGKGGGSLSGFGIVTLASLFPIIGVESLAVYLSVMQSPEQIIEAARNGNQIAQAAAWHEVTPGAEVATGLRAIVPLVIFLLLVMLVLLRERIKNPAHVAYGIVLSILGMIIFNLGLSYGLSKLGNQSGSLIPSAFMVIDMVQNSPLYSLSLGLLIALGFAWVLGFGATLAEPALNALGITVENLTNGAFRKSMLLYSVSFGVGFGIALGVAKIIFDIPLVYLILPGYVISIVLTMLSTEEFVNVAWDSAGVTTGPVTVPLVLSMGLGFGDAVDAIEGFGILSMASIGPIIAVLATGLWVQWKIKRKHRRSESMLAEPAT